MSLFANKVALRAFIENIFTSLQVNVFFVSFLVTIFTPVKIAYHTFLSDKSLLQVLTKIIILIDPQMCVHLHIFPVPLQLFQFVAMLEFLESMTLIGVKSAFSFDETRIQNSYYNTKLYCFILLSVKL